MEYVHMCADGLRIWKRALDPLELQLYTVVSSLMRDELRFSARTANTLNHWVPLLSSICTGIFWYLLSAKRKTMWQVQGAACRQPDPLSGPSYAKHYIFPGLLQLHVPQYPGQLLLSVCTWEIFLRHKPDHLIVCVSVSVSMCLCTCMLCVRACVHMCMRVCMRMHMCVWTCVCMHARVHAHHTCVKAVCMEVSSQHWGPSIVLHFIIFPHIYVY